MDQRGRGGLSDVGEDLREGSGPVRKEMNVRGGWQVGHTSGKTS
jgi:hypothetical protein